MCDEQLKTYKLRKFLQPYAEKLAASKTIYSNINAFEFILEATFAKKKDPADPNYAPMPLDWIALSKCHSKEATEFMADNWNAWYMNYPAWENICENPHAIPLLEAHWGWLSKYHKIYWFKIFANEAAMDFVDTHWDWLMENNKLGAHAMHFLLSNKNICELIDRRFYWFMDQKVFTGANLSDYPALFPLIEKHWYVLIDQLDWAKICRNPDSILFLKSNWDWIKKRNHVVWLELIKNPAAIELIPEGKIERLCVSQKITTAELCRIENIEAMEFVLSNWNNWIKTKEMYHALYSNPIAYMYDIIDETMDDTDVPINVLLKMPEAIGRIEEYWDELFEKYKDYADFWDALSSNRAIFEEYDGDDDSNNNNIMLITKNGHTTNKYDNYNDVELDCKCGCQWFSLYNILTWLQYIIVFIIGVAFISIVVYLVFISAMEDIILRRMIEGNGPMIYFDNNGTVYCPYRAT